MGETLARRGDLAAPPAPPLILASTSPRRREILEQLRIPFDVVVPQYEETLGDPVEHALGKARSVGPFDDRPVLGCDTEVICGGRVYGKPESEEDAGEHEYYDDPPVEWARQWPAEEIWRLRLRLR